MVNLISGKRLAPARNHLHRRAFLPKPKRARLRLKSSFFFQKTYFSAKKRAMPLPIKNKSIILHRKTAETPYYAAR